MRIVLNGEGTDVDAHTVAGMLDELGYTGTRVAVAVAGEHVPRSLWSRTDLNDGAHVEVVAPQQGG